MWNSVGFYQVIVYDFGLGFHSGDLLQ
jgi:hypothetical protein